MLQDNDTRKRSSACGPSVVRINVVVAMPKKPYRLSIDVSS
jgi:hypothetical protein